MAACSLCHKLSGCRRGNAGLGVKNIGWSPDSVSASSSLVTLGTLSLSFHICKMAQIAGRIDVKALADLSHSGRMWLFSLFSPAACHLVSHLPWPHCGWISGLGRKKGGALSDSGSFPRCRAGFPGVTRGSKYSNDGTNPKGQFCEMFFRTSKQGEPD